MIIRASTFKALDAKKLKRFNTDALEVEIIKALINQPSTYLGMYTKVILPEVDGDQRHGIEVGINDIALHRQDYRKVLEFLFERMGNDKEHPIYRQIRSIMKKKHTKERCWQYE